MRSPSAELIRRSGYARSGFPARYDEHRPAPPPPLLEVLARLARVERPRCVVDLGTGTGLSARAWSERSEQVVGVEPNFEMLAEARARTSAPNVRYVGAYAAETALENGCADIVTCSQSLHWMEPEPTFAEVARILRSGGVFAAYDYDVPPLVDPEVDTAFLLFLEQARLRLDWEPTQKKSGWRKEHHLDRMRASRRFRHTREVVLHGTDRGDADRLLGFARSLGRVADDEEGLAELTVAVERVLAAREVEFLWGYRVRLGVK